MPKSKCQMLNAKRGITLVALVITVIVLLILAGTAVSISINSGNIFERANAARTEWNNAVAKEEGELANLINILNQVSSGSQATGAGYQEADRSFIGLKSIGKINAGEIDNYWQSAEQVTVGGNDGYKFAEGHFLRVTNYTGFLWDETQNNWVEKTADVYLCWNADYGTITSEQDLIDYANNHSTTTYWDIFDASSGAWLTKDLPKD